MKDPEAAQEATNTLRASTRSVMPDSKGTASM